MQQYINIESAIVELNSLKEVLGSNRHIHDKDLFAYENQINAIVNIIKEISNNDKNKEFEKSWIL